MFSNRKIFRFKSCWPALQKDTNGVILVADAAQKAQLRDLEEWYRTFAVQRGVQPAHCIVFLHQKPDDAGSGTKSGSATSQSSLRMPGAISNLACVVTNIEQDGDAVRLEFNNFLCNVIAGLSTVSIE